jgi:hypothetical protein
VLIYRAQKLGKALVHFYRLFIDLSVMNGEESRETSDSRRVNTEEQSGATELQHLRAHIWRQVQRLPRRSIISGATSPWTSPKLAVWTRPFRTALSPFGERYTALSPGCAKFHRGQTEVIRVTSNEKIISN